MKKQLYIAMLLLACSASMQAQDTLWVRYDDRFKPNKSFLLKDVDSILFKSSLMQFAKNNGTTSSQQYSSVAPIDGSDMSFTNPGRYLLKPNTYSGTNYTNDAATSGYNFAHHLESEHFAVFWDVRYGENPAKIQYPGDGNVANANTVLSIAEKCWQMYANELGFLEEGHSTTDRYKIQLYIPYQKDWRADASGTDGVGGGMTGIGHFNPWAAVARGGHTIAHEVGHTFQYLVSGAGDGAAATTTAGGRAVPTGRPTRYSPNGSSPTVNTLSSTSAPTT